MEEKLTLPELVRQQAYRISELNQTIFKLENELIANKKKIRILKDSLKRRNALLSDVFTGAIQVEAIDPESLLTAHIGPLAHEWLTKVGIIW